MFDGGNFRMAYAHNVCTIIKKTCNIYAEKLHFQTRNITMVLKMTLSCQFSKMSVVETNNNITNLKLSDGFCDAGTENAVLFAFQ